jgi:hypothetical protein
MSEAPFSYSSSAIGPNLFKLTYSGYMGEQDRAQLTETTRLFAEAKGSIGLYYEVPEMTGFHRSQVALHGELFLKHRDRLTGIAVVGARPAVRFGSITVSLIARITLQHFGTRDEAVAWLRSLTKKA